MLIGYARVSKTDGSQSLDLQRDALRAAGVDDAVNLYHDLASGVRDDRPGLDSCLRALRKGDVLVVWKLDRLSRNLAHLVNTVQDLSARGVGLRVFARDGAQIDTTTAAGRLVFPDWEAPAGLRPRSGGPGLRRLRRGGRARGAEGGALPEHGPGGAAADGPDARAAVRLGDDQAARLGHGASEERAGCRYSPTANPAPRRHPQCIKHEYFSCARAVRHATLPTC